MAVNVYKGRTGQDAVRYTYQGFEKTKIPEELFKAITNEYDTCNNERKWQQGIYLFGKQ
jgi:tRNA uridine 5-carbamoylmethylation protein Kti12